MGQEVRYHIAVGDSLPVSTTRITMVDPPLGATEDRLKMTRRQPLKRLSEKKKLPSFNNFPSHARIALADMAEFEAIDIGSPKKQ